MGSKNHCMNEACRGTATPSSEWKKGWGLKCGGFSNLCFNCGYKSAYESSMFCETFHLEESGWRECRICGKRIHCGCIASRHLHEFMDYGGIWCTNCSKRLEVHPVPPPIKVPLEFPKGTLVLEGLEHVRPPPGTIILEDLQDVHPPSLHNNRIDDEKFSTEKLLQLTKAIGTMNANSTLEQFKKDDSIFKPRQTSKRPPTLPEQSSVSTFIKSDNGRPKEGIKSMYESLAQPSINFSLASPLGSSATGAPFPGGIAEGSSQNNASSPQGQRARQILPKPPKPTISEMNKGGVLQARVARPPAEGRGRNQLLPRYWPRITDQELQQLSGDLKSTIIPLFEKILSASDAGRIGRLVLPKACAELYFPPINQSEGIPIRIQDIKGKEWTFQFRFWPNNNSRMYVLEGVTPCIQNMQVQAGDTVTFSRIDPGGQLVIGCRKATNSGEGQDSQTVAFPNGDLIGETSYSGITNGGKTSEDLLQKDVLVAEKKKARNIKNKRLLMHNDDVMELRITWEEAQELLRPSPTSKPSVVMVEDHEFEEFEEPPVFGKRTIFTSRPSGEQAQLAQCDNCSKWRRVPVQALISATWTCSDNTWDSKRCLCSAPEDLNPKNLENIHGIYKGSKKRKISPDNKVPKGGDRPSGLDALATAAVLGDNLADAAESSVGATTRHPRHRPGCTCIVCIQPPSGKGKHEPTCKCNVCLTVRRRFKTLMMRKKKKQSEREAELTHIKDNKAALPTAAASGKPNPEEIIGVEAAPQNIDPQDNNNKLDLNSDPRREDDASAAEVKLAPSAVPAPAMQNGTSLQQTVEDWVLTALEGDGEKVNDRGGGPGPTTGKGEEVL